MNGLIAFFDILGYQSFLENNNSATATAEKVLKIITDTPEQVRTSVLKSILSRIGGLPGIPIKEVESSLNHLVFSDTIVLSIEYPENASADWIKTALNYFVAVSAELYLEMFKEGLPMRGAIVEGNFLVRQHCFAGQAIVDAYKLCASLDFSGIVIHPKMNTRLQEIYAGWPINLFFVDYLSPMNNSSEAKLLHINWPDSMSKEELLALRQDVESFVFRSFWSHNKDISRSANSKAENTIKLIRRFSIRLEEIDNKFKTGN